MVDKSRRNFIGWGFGGVAAIGAAAALVPMKRTWDPNPSALSSGFTSVNLESLPEGTPTKILWRGKPVFLLKKSDAMEKDATRDIVANGNHYMVAIGLCTHLGCIPTWREGTLDFKCPCHGGEFNASGKQTFGPPPKPLVIPPFSQDGTTIVLGEEGPEYKKLLEAQA